MLSSSKDISHVSLFIAISAAMGFLFAYIPNIELITCSVFLSGILMGKLRGIIVGASAYFLFSSLNPNGSGLAFPPLLITQVFIYSLIGLCGGIISLLINLSELKPVNFIILGFSGLILTLLYQITTAAVYYYIAGFTEEQFTTVIVTGILFSAVHIVSNTIIFSTVLPLLLKKTVKLGYFINKSFKNT